MAFSREPEAEMWTRTGKILLREMEKLAVSRGRRAESRLELTMGRAEFSEAPAAD